jgi:hypothetical protein
MTNSPYDYQITMINSGTSGNKGQLFIAVERSEDGPANGGRDQKIF